MKIGRALLPIIAGVLVAATGCADWPYPQFNAGSTADNATETTITSANVSTLTQKWAYHPPSGWATSSLPLDAGGSVFASEEGQVQGQYVSRLVALDERSGAIRWSRALPRKSRPLGIVNGLLIVNLDRMYRDVAGQPPNTSLAAFSVTDGTPKWVIAPTQETGVDFAHLVSGGGLLYVVGPLGLIAVEPTSGKVRWVSCATTNSCKSEIVGDPGYGLAYDGGRLYLGSHGVDAGGVFDAATGTFLWTERVRSGGGAWQGPAVSGGKSYLADGVGYNASPVGQVAAFPAAGCGTSYCDAAWHTDLPDPVYGYSAVTAKQLFVGGGASVFALDAVTGRRQWTGQVADGGANQISVAGDVVYANGARHLYAFRATGCGTATCQPALILPNTYGAPIIANGLMIDSDASGVYALAPKAK